MLKAETFGSFTLAEWLEGLRALQSVYTIIIWYLDTTDSAFVEQPRALD